MRSSFEASESLTSIADGVQEATSLTEAGAVQQENLAARQVVDQVVDFEMSEAEKDLYSRAEGLLGEGPRDKNG